MSNCSVDELTSALDKSLNSFQTEYFAQWGMDYTYDKPINTVEKDNKKILQYELIGLNERHIIVEKEFINKTRKLFVKVTGKFTDELTDWKNDINIKLEVDYNIYNNVTYSIQDGILTIILHEIINDEPVVRIAQYWNTL